MEHNEYAVHRCTVRFMADVIDHSVEDESPLVGTQETVSNLVIVAPAGDLGDDLIRLHVARKFRFVSQRLPGGQTHIIESHSQEKIHSIIQYEDRYRGQF